MAPGGQLVLVRANDYRIDGGRALEPYYTILYHTILNFTTLLHSMLTIAYIGAIDLWLTQ